MCCHIFINEFSHAISGFANEIRYLNSARTTVHSSRLMLTRSFKSDRKERAAVQWQVRKITLAEEMLACWRICREFQ
jgi:hypothetical protein